MSQKSMYEALSAKASLAPLGAIGRVFFVNGIDGVGLNTNQGGREDPFLTLTYALSQCVANRNDVIVIQDYWQPTGETWPILVNIHQVHIIGAALRNLPYPSIHPPADTAAFEIANTGQNSEIANLMIGGGNAHGGIETGSIANGMGNGLWVHDCWLGHNWFGTPLAGIRNLGTINACGIRIERCKFLGDQANCTGAITATAIDNALGVGGAWWDDCDFLNNYFLGCQIALDLYARTCLILDNRFITPDDGGIDGEAVTLQAGSVGCMVDGNRAMSGGDAAMTDNPYRDLGGAGGANNSWGINRAGIVAAALPAVA